jgi:hypothetical protein
MFKTVLFLFAASWVVLPAGCDRQGAEAPPEDPLVRRVRERRQREDAAHAARQQEEQERETGRRQTAAKLEPVLDVLLRLQVSADAAGPRFDALVEDLQFQLRKAESTLTEAERQGRPYLLAAEAAKHYSDARACRRMADEPFPAVFRDLHKNQPLELFNKELEWQKDRREYADRYQESITAAMRAGGAARTAAQYGL